MSEHRFRLRARYPETDQMGIVHHTNHFVWFEIGRTELLRELGLPYAALEARHIFMPVIEAGAPSQKNARYGRKIVRPATGPARNGGPGPVGDRAPGASPPRGR